MPTKSIAIAWTMPDPPLTPKRWQRWVQVPEPTEDDDATESSLRWPTATLAVLRQAFEARQTRTVGWETAQSLDEGPREAVQTGARVFKRGVAYRLEGEPLTTTTGSGRYDITIEDSAAPPSDLFDRAAFVILDGHVARSWTDFAAGVPGAYVTTLDEHSKTLDSVGEMLNAWRASDRSRDWVVVGGGLLTDVAAFAASLVEARVTFVPTTLLSMVDASVGGKTGVNFPPYGKNQLGRFYFPVHVRVWTGWLSSLPIRELRAGGAECLKHAFLLGDADLAEDMARHVATGDLSGVARRLPPLIELKAEVVREDVNESGRRATLNFGHTLAHALEAVSQESTQAANTLLHGEAVGIGMLFAVQLSEQVAGLPSDEAQTIRENLRRAACLPDARELASRLGVRTLEDPALLSRIMHYIAHDKKSGASAQQGDGIDTSDWILFSGLGQIAQTAGRTWTLPVSNALVRDCWRRFVTDTVSI